MLFPVVIYRCESWTIKKTEHRRIDAFQLWCWRRFLRVPWTARRSNQSILKEMSPEYSLEGLMVKLKLQYFGHLMWITDSLGKTLLLGKIEGRRRGQQRMRWLDDITNSMNRNLTKLWALVIDGQGGLACCSPWGCREFDTTERLNWTECKQEQITPNMPASVSKFQAQSSVLCFVRLEQSFCKPHFHFACCLSVELHLAEPLWWQFLWVSLQPHLHPGSRVPAQSSSEMQLTGFPTLKKVVSLHHFRDTSTNQQTPPSQALKLPTLRAP